MIKRLLCFILILIGTPLYANAESRDIYVGDIIALEVSADNVYEEELREAFKNFEIIDIKDTSDGYLLSIRTFETGEQRVVIGNKEIVINVRSALTDIERDELYEGDARVQQPGFSFLWRIVFSVAAGVFVLSCGYILVKVIKKRKIKAMSPHQLFLWRSANLLVDSDNYFVELTFYFKELIGSLHNCRIIGKTSAEIIAELKPIETLTPMLPEISSWLIECDRFKFTGVQVSKAEKQEHYTLLLDLVDRIEAI